MGSKSLLGGISQDSTLREILELMDTSQNDSSDFALPIRTVEEVPLDVAGKVVAEQAGLGQAVTSKFDSTSNTTWSPGLVARSNRTGLIIYNDMASASVAGISFQDPNNLNGQGMLALKLNPGDYWEAPCKYVGPVFYQWQTASVAVSLRMTEFF